jgi:hypothetical protein
LLSRIEVGLIIASAVSEKFLKVRPVSNFGNEVGFLNLSVGDGIELCCDIRACLLVAVLDLFFIISIKYYIPTLSTNT